MSDKFKLTPKEREELSFILQTFYVGKQDYSFAINRIESIISERDGWIDVEDRLPDPVTEVLGFTLGGYGVECLLFEDDNRFYAPSERIRKPTHWQELPSAPKQPKK